MKLRILIPAAVVGLLLVGVAAEARQQAGAGAGGQSPAAPGSDTIALVFEREVFAYPSYDRRNPFRPLTGDESGPRFEELRLVGILYSDDPRESLAVLGVQGGTGARATTGRTFRVRVGETLGNSRILEIRRDQVVAAVDEFGVVETRTLEVRRPDWAAREGEPAAPSAPLPDTLRASPPPPGGGGGGDPNNGFSESWNGGSS